MLSEILTPDNQHLSRPTKALAEAEIVFAIDCNFSRSNRLNDISICESGLDAKVADLLANSISANTRRAYQADLAHFETWGGGIPASPSTVASYLAVHAEKLSVATLVRRVATISKVHEAKSLSNPCRTEIVRATLRGIKRTYGIAQHEAKPLLKEDLFVVLDAMGDGMKAARDRALLLLGFAGGFRRSELIGLDCENLEHVRQGLIITLRRSKTDQEGAGRKIGIPLGRTRYCPVAAVHAWLSIARIQSGPIFRRVDRHGHVLRARLSGDAVSTVVRERLSAIGINPEGFSGHSLRAGLATSAAQAGVSALKIRSQTGHATDAMLARYIRCSEMFSGNAAGALL